MPFMSFTHAMLRRLLVVLLLAPPLALPVVLGSAAPALAALRGDDYPLREDPRVCPNCTSDGMHGFYIRECTSFVAWRLQEVNGYDLQGPIPGGAGAWGTKYASITDSHPKRGSVAWFQGDDGRPGHVAWVADVIGTDVLIEEYNYGFKHRYHSPARTEPASSFTGFIHFKDLDAAPPTPEPPPTPQPPAPQPPVIVSAGTYREGVLVYARANYTDVNGDADGFGFRWRWGTESHPFSNPSFGRVSAGRVDYPFNLGCGGPSEHAVGVQLWIYDRRGLQSRPVTLHLECRGGT